MKANIVKQLHDLGVYRSPFTKQKLENMKLGAESFLWLHLPVTGGNDW